MGAVFRALTIPVDVGHLLPSVSQAGARRISQPPTPARAVVDDGRNLRLIRALVDGRTAPPSWRVSGYSAKAHVYDARSSRRARHFQEHARSQWSEQRTDPWRRYPLRGRCRSSRDETLPPDWACRELSQPTTGIAGCR